MVIAEMLGNEWAGVNTIKAVERGWLRVERAERGSPRTESRGPKEGRNPKGEPGWSINDGGQAQSHR